MAKKNVLIFVHGVGKHDTGWALNDTKAAPYLEEVLGEYPEFAGNPLSNDVAFEEITYDATFETVRQQWVELSTSLSGTGMKGYDQASLAAIQQRIGDDANRLGQELAQDKFAVTHALDAVMYKGFPLIQDIVCHHVAAQLAAIVAKHLADANADPRVIPTFTIVAHSLGTAVVYDALQLLSTRAWLTTIPAFIGTQNDQLGGQDLQGGVLDSMYGANPFGGDSLFDWHGLVMVSNVSRFMSEARARPDRPESVVKPEWAPNTNGRVLRFYYNIDHALDPTAKLKPFSCKELWARAWDEGRAEDIDDLGHIYDANVHGLTHYIKNPRVHARIAYLCAPDRVNGYRFVRFADRKVADGSFARYGEPFADADNRSRLVAKLQEILDTNPRGKTEEKYQSRVEQLKDLT